MRTHHPPLRTISPRRFVASSVPEPQVLAATAVSNGREMRRGSTDMISVSQEKSDECHRFVQGTTSAYKYLPALF